MVDLKKALGVGSSKDQALEKTGEVALTRKPDWFKDDGDVRGIEHITKDDVQMPRLGLGQGLSPQVQEADPKYIEGLKIGDLFNNLTNEIYGKGPMYFTVVRADRPRGIEFFPLESGGGIKDFTVSLNDPRMNFGPNGERPAATKFYDFIIMLLPSRELIALSFKSTGLKVARQLNGLMKIRNAPSFLGRYELTTAMEKNRLGTYAQYVIKNAGCVSEEVYELGKKLYEGLKDKVIEIERERPEVEVVDDPKVGFEGDQKPPF